MWHWKQYIACEVCESHCGVGEDSSLLGTETVLLGKSFLSSETVLLGKSFLSSNFKMQGTTFPMTQSYSQNISPISSNPHPVVVSSCFTGIRYISVHLHYNVPVIMWWLLEHPGQYEP